MAFFTSAYKVLAHLAPNWDTQLRADMQSLEDNLSEATFGPQLGGSNATLGNSAGYGGTASRKGSKVTYDGRFVFGSGASFGNGTPVILNLNQLGTTLADGQTIGYGVFIPASGTLPTTLLLTRNTSSAVTIRKASDGTFVTSISVAQSDQLIFHVESING